MRVQKRNGELVQVRLDEITDRIAFLCKDLSAIDPVKITIEVVEKIHDGISTSKIDSFTAEICNNKSIIHPDFGVLAARLIISDQHKINCSTNFSKICDKLYYNFDNLGVQAPLISRELLELSREYSNEINQMIDHNRDFLFDYFGYKTLQKAYLLKINDNPVETPQYMFMRVALGIWSRNLEKVKETYDLLSLKYFIHATPTLYNSGTERPQLFSCFLLGIDDNIESIFKVLSDTAQISKWSGGIGIHISSIRSNGSYIRKTGGYSDGIVPMLKVYNDTARYINQGGGKRLGSFAVYIEPWHADIEDFLRCKLNHGDENRRARDLFYALWIPDLFMKRVKNGELWSLMDPGDCPGLEKVYGEEFEKLYEEYEKNKFYKKQIKAQDLFNQIVSSQIETGTPYMVYKDSANKKSNQKNLGTIRSSNLCSEIIEYSDTNKYACCVLASLVLPTYVENNNFNHQKLYEVTRVVVRNLNHLIDINYYPVIETRNSNLSERPIGVGVQGLHDVFFSLHMPYDSEEALILDKEIHETIYFAAMTESCELAKEQGVYNTYKGSPISQGKFQFDLWAEYDKHEIKHSGRWDWNELRNNIKIHGVRNSLVTALMPTASTSQIMGSTAEAFEPVTSNCYTRRTKSGEFMLLNKYMARDFIKEGFWNEKMREKLLVSRGSIQSFKDIPQRYKDIYKTVWELKQKTLIDHSLARGIYIDQSQSLNLYYEDNSNLSPLIDRVTAGHFYGWSRGIKTGSYYIRSKPAANSVSFTIDHDNDMNHDNADHDNDMDHDNDVNNHEVDHENDDCSVCGA